MSWYAPLRDITSLGSQAKRPGSLAGLHTAREEHKGQFFTPDSLAAYIWRLLSPVMDNALTDLPRSKVALLDNSVGSGRLLQFAAPDKHTLSGVDIHHETIARVIETTQAAGFECEFLACGMEEVRPRNYNIAIINPPFSLHLESPCLSPLSCTTWGKYGRNTSAQSDHYAVAQALDAAEIVAAILPEGTSEEIEKTEWAAPRLRAILTLPLGSFSDEGTAVRVKLLVFGRDKSNMSPLRIKVANLTDPTPYLELECGATAHKASLHPYGADTSKPSITLPVTGERIVRVAHDGRRIKLIFSCGLTQAEVLNAIYKDRIATVAIPDHRYPRGLRYDGEGALDMEAHLIQADPHASLDALFARIRHAGGIPVCAPGFMEHFRNRLKRSRRQATPLAHTVFDKQGGSKGSLTGTARKTHVADPGTWMSPVIKAGDMLAFEPQEDNSYTYSVGGKLYRSTLEELGQKFDFQGDVAAGWVVKHQGLLAKYPQQAEQLRARARRLGIDKWLWDYQFDDLVELLLKPQGAVVAWEMGLGKARLAIAMILLSGVKHGLICVEPYLVDEMKREINGLPITEADWENYVIEKTKEEMSHLPVASDQWQVITNPEGLKNLKAINIISYSRLRTPVDQTRPKHTYGKALRRRIGLLCADEGHLLRNGNSQQSRALWNISAKRRFCFTGTPVANYPRDILAILAFTGGDSTAAQPWGWRRGYLDQLAAVTMQTAQRGIDAFREKFVTTEWVTNEFAEDLTSGAKREIPKIASLDAYRAAIAPHIKRRLAKEPEVAPLVKIPEPVIETLQILWDERHLLHYITVAQDFATWYQDMKRRNGDNRNNLIAILARIQAVQFACNYPQKPKDGCPTFYGLTSKQRFAVNKLEELTRSGHKTILYMHNPGALELIGQELAHRGIDSLVFHGGQNINQRTEELNRRFREGDCPNLLASLGVTQAGLNLYQADRVILGSRDWSWKTESQAIHRVLRPQQERDVVVSCLELPGSIDTYQAQAVAFKRDSMQAGLDWGTPETDNVDFLHLDTIIGRFCEEIARLHSVERHKLREYLECRAA